MAALLEEFIGITEGLNRQGIEYAVCGGWAMAIHGFLRATIDIDIIILTSDLDRVLDVARLRGFDIEGRPLEFDNGRTQIRRLSKVDQNSKELITLDMILVTESMTGIWDDKVRVEWNHGKYSVVSREGMIEMKTVAGRPKDLVDLEYLRGGLDES